MCTYTSSNCNAIIALQFIIVVSQQKQKDPPIQTRLVHWSSPLSVTSWLLESCDRCFCCIVSAFSECFRRVMWLSVTQTSSRVRSWKPHTDSSKQIFTGGPRSLPDAADTLPADWCGVVGRKAWVRRERWQTGNGHRCCPISTTGPTASLPVQARTDIYRNLRVTSVSFSHHHSEYEQSLIGFNSVVL